MTTKNRLLAGLTFCFLTSLPLSAGPRVFKAEHFKAEVLLRLEKGYKTTDELLGIKPNDREKNHEQAKKDQEKREAFWRALGEGESKAVKLAERFFAKSEDKSSSEFDEKQFQALRKSVLGETESQKVLAQAIENVLMLNSPQFPEAAHLGLHLVKSLQRGEINPATALMLAESARSETSPAKLKVLDYLLASTKSTEMVEAAQSFQARKAEEIQGLAVLVEKPSQRLKELLIEKIVGSENLSEAKAKELQELTLAELKERAGEKVTAKEMQEKEGEALAETMKEMLDKTKPEERETLIGLLKDLFKQRKPCCVLPALLAAAATESFLGPSQPENDLQQLRKAIHEQASKGTDGLNEVGFRRHQGKIREADGHL